MPSFLGIHIAKSGMQAHQKAMEVTAHNISNVNSPGYSRQQAVFRSAGGHQLTLYGNGVTQVGQGTGILAVRRMANQYLDNRMFYQNANLAYWSDRSNTLSKAEGFFTDLQGSGINDKLNAFWGAWHKLALNPENMEARYVVQQEATGLVDTVNTVANSLLHLTGEINAILNDNIMEINAISREIAGLNREIFVHQQQGQPPNDLLDRRSELVKQLVGLTGATVLQENETAPVTITLGEEQLVGETGSEELTLTQVENLFGQGLGGNLAGLISARDSITGPSPSSYLNKLNEMVRTLVTEVNQVHTLGYNQYGVTGGTFFTPGSAENPALTFNLAADIKLDAGKIAATGQPGTGNGDVALTIANLSRKSVLAGNTQTIGEYFVGLLAQIGSESKNASLQMATQQDIMTEIQHQRNALSGVSIDEELTNMVQYQRAYQASAKVLSVIDEMLDTLINRTGR